MDISRPTRRFLAVAVAVLVAALCAVALRPATGEATSRTITLRVFDKPVSLKLTRADGTVVDDATSTEPRPGDVLEVHSLGFRGDHREHSRRPIASALLRCRFSETAEPDCESHTAIGGSLLVFRGNPGTLVNGAGRFLGAAGRVVSSTEVSGGSNIVLKIRLADRR